MTRAQGKHREFSLNQNVDPGSVWTCMLCFIVLLWHHSRFQLQFLNKPYMKSCLFVSFRGSTPEGTQDRVLHD